VGLRFVGTRCRRGTKKAILHIMEGGLDAVITAHQKDPLALSGRWRYQTAERHQDTIYAEQKTMHAMWLKRGHSCTASVQKPLARYQQKRSLLYSQRRPPETRCVGYRCLEQR